MARITDGSEEEEHTMLLSADYAPRDASQYSPRSGASMQSSQYIVDGDAISVDTCDNFRTLPPFLTAESKHRGGEGSTSCGVEGLWQRGEGEGSLDSSSVGHL